MVCCTRVSRHLAKGRHALPSHHTRCNIPNTNTNFRSSCFFFHPRDGKNGQVSPGCASLASRCQEREESFAGATVANMLYCTAAAVSAVIGRPVSLLRSPRQTAPHKVQLDIFLTFRLLHLSNQNNGLPMLHLEQDTLPSSLLCSVSATVRRHESVADADRVLLGPDFGHAHPLKLSGASNVSSSAGAREAGHRHDARRSAICTPFPCPSLSCSSSSSPVCASSCSISLSWRW